MTGAGRGARRPRFPRAGLAWLVLLVALVAAPAGNATDAGSAQVADLAAAAESGDGAALASLEAVTSVDGRPADFAQALAGAEGKELQARLREIEESVTQIGTAAPGKPTRETVEQQPQRDEGGGEGGVSLGVGAPGILQILVVLLIVGLAVALASYLDRRRVLDVAASAPRRSAGGDVVEGPRALEQLALEAERAGDFDAALGLRFRAGLIRLDEAGAVKLRPSLTPATAARETGSDTLTGLAGTYSRVLYGGQQAGAEDARAARERWPHVLGESGTVAGSFEADRA